jgi:predicted RNase H-like HicB family nuclease
MGAATLPTGGISVKFSVLIERDEDGYCIASVSELLGCHTQARTLDELTSRIKEAIELYLETEGTKTEEKIELVGVQFIEVPLRELFIEKPFCHN